MNGRLLDAYRRDDDVAQAELGASVTGALEPPEFLDFEFTTGNHTAFAVQNLLSVHFEPSQGITLHFTGHDVLVTGLRLLPLYLAIIEQRVARVRTPEVDAGDPGGGDLKAPPHVLTISVTKSD